MWGYTHGSVAIPRSRYWFTSLLSAALLIIGTITMAADGKSLRTDFEQNYEKLCHIQLPNGVPVEKFRSRRTGLHVILAKVQGPLVSGYFTFATEAKDDDGLPHTLEHLVFLGSEKYPYKGVLDLLANRCLASGTNAWTDTDHTAYTIETAGSEGFLNHLPVYLDHLLYPTLTDAGFTTEVYHMTGDGEDAGVVYSEMQSRENSGDDRSYLAMQRALYPEQCGLRYETGGLMENLRNTTSNEKIRAYHRTFYRPENLHLIIAGQVETEPLFDVLQTFEDTIVKKQGPRPPFDRPWQTPVPDLLETVRTEVLYPSEAQDNGKVLVSWRGPSVVDQYRLLLSLEVLLEYLTYSSVSPLPSVFVESAEPLASEVSQYCTENQASNCYLKFTGVPVEVMDQVEPLLRATLSNVRYATNGSDGIDLTAVQEILYNLILSDQSDMETSPRDTLAYSIIGDVLYGNTCFDLEQRLDKISWYAELLTKPLTYWQGLLKDYLLDRPSVVVLARPSKQEADRLDREEREMIERRRRELGEEGLRRKEEKLNRAEEFNELPPPPSMLSSLPIPSPSSVNFHTLRPYSNHPRHDATMASVPDDHPAFNLTALPLRFQLDDVQSNFVTLTAILDTSTLPASQRLYLPLILEIMFESGVLRDGERELPYSTVVRKLSADLVFSSVEMGLSIGGSGTFSCGPFCNYVMLIMKFKASKYPAGVSWLHDVMYNLKPTVSRLKVKTAKLLNSIADDKRSGPKILALMHRGVMFDPESNHNQVNMIRQREFLTKLSKRLKDPVDGPVVLQDIMAIIKALTSPDCVTMHMATNVTKLATTVDVEEPWRRFVRDLPAATKSKRLQVVVDSDYRTFSGRTPSGFPLSTTVGSRASPPAGAHEYSFNNPNASVFDNRTTSPVPPPQPTAALLAHRRTPNDEDSAHHRSTVTTSITTSTSSISSSTSSFISTSSNDTSVSDNNRTNIENEPGLLLELHSSIVRSNEVADITATGDRSVAGDEVTAWVYGLSSADSGYLQQSALSISHHTHWDLPALMTAIQYFTQYEGPMWREIRGTGLAYNYNMQLLPSEGLITLKLLRAAQLMEAYTETINMLAGHMNGSIPWEPLLLESAKSSLLFEVIYREEAVSDVVQQSLLAYFRRVPHSYNRELLEHISRVTMADVQRVSAHYFAPMIDPLTSRTVIVCHPTEITPIIGTLNSYGHQVEQVGPLASSRFA